MWAKLKHWIEVRIGLEELVNRHLRSYRTPRGANFLNTLGFVALIAFIVQVITGIMLLLYYLPHPDHAFQSVQRITNEIPYGWLFRLIHNIGSNIIIAVIIIHLVHVFFRVSYKRPREVTWITGCLMFFLVLLTSITGQLLPWHQTGFWQTTVTSTIPAFLPFIGEGISSYMRGGEFVTGITLSRYFSFHVVILPVIISALIGLHVLLIRRQGISTSPALEPENSNIAKTEFSCEEHRQGQPCFPHFSLKRLFMVMIYFVVLFFIMTFMPNLFLPPEANMPANPLMTPETIRPAWYFLAPYQLIKTIPNDLLGISLLALFTIIFTFWPFFDAKEEERNIRKRPALMGVVLVLLALWACFTVWGMY
ncbi:MAG: cytochrome bc complex cytochrome b subunit [Desulfobulbales bacterium]|nr:cytochrome bc complex cytochrome b subunit [Desulfobulbales bacterium]